MNKGILLPKKIFYGITILCSIIIFIECLDIIISFKNFTYLYATTEYVIDSPIYLNFMLMNFFIKVIPIMVLGIYCYFALFKFKVNKKFPISWIVLISIIFVYTFIQFSFFSIFYYMKLVGYIGLIIYLVKLSKRIKEEGEICNAKV